MRVAPFVLAALAVLLPSTAEAQASSPTDPIEKLVGVWRLDRPSSTLPPTQQEGQRPPQGRGQGGGGRPPGGGGGVPGMGRMGIPGMGGGQQQPNDDDLRRLDILRRRLAEAPEQLTITRRGVEIAFADSDGRAFTLKADGKRQDRVTGDGEFKTRARLEDGKLIVEDDFGDGAKVFTTYSSMLYGDERLLEIDVRVEGLPAGRPRMPGGTGGQSGPDPTSSKRTYEADRK